MKSKIQKTSRIRVKVLATVVTMYCSSHVIREVGMHTMRLANNVHVPLRGHTDELVKNLKELAKSHPDHFTESGRIILGDPVW